MKNKGFTLTELLGVIVILIVIFTLTFPVVNKLISQGKDTVYQTQINKILTATSDFSLQHVKYLPDYKEKSYVTLGELKHEGIISADLKDPNAGEYFKDDVVISIENVGTNYKNSNKNSFLKGSYLYTVEIGRNTDKSLLPVISMNPIKADSNGNYFLLLNLNQEYTDIAVTASSKKGVDLTNKIKK